MHSKLHGSKRTYYFNYFNNKASSNIIEVIESKIVNGEKKFNKILIFEEDLEAFQLELNLFLAKNL